MNARFLILLLTVSIATAPLFAQNRPVDRIIKTIDDPQSKQVLVAAHRGDWHNFPENSLEAVMSAVALGVDIIEIDIQRTSDGQLVLMHDKSVDRVTNGKGLVSTFTLDSLRKLRLKNGLGRVTRFTIPTLEQVMVAVRGKAMINLDKGYDFFKESYIILEKTGTIDHVITKSEHPFEKVKQENGELLSKLRYMPVVSIAKPEAANIIAVYQKNMKPVAYELNFASDTLAMIGQFKTIGKNSRIWMNSLWASLNGGHEDDLAAAGDLKNSYDWIIDKGATIIQTDRPELLLQYLRKRKLHL